MKTLVVASASFSRTTIVAEVTPSIPRPVELFGEIVGPWVHQIATDRFEVSPLLRNAGQAILDAPLQERIHLALALHLFNGRAIDQQQASQIIVHLLLAKSWHILAGFLLQLAYQLREKPHAQAFEFFVSLFASSWPPEIPLQLRIAFRTFQARILALIGEETRSFVDDLDAMIHQETSSASLEAFLALLLIGPINSASDSTTAARRTLQACRTYHRLPPEIPRFPFQAPLETLMWMGLKHLQTQDDVRGVVAVLADMTEEERKAAFSFEMLDDALQLFVDYSWMIEVMKAEAEQDWDGVLALLDEIFQIAQRPGGEPLLAPVERARAIVLANYMERPQEALDALAQVSQAADNNTRFLLHYTAASILLDHRMPEVALQRFQQALSESPSAYAFLYFDALRRAAEAAGRISQWQIARDLAIRSLMLPLKDEFFYEQLEMIGELAWTYWSLGNRVKACSAMSGVVRGLMRSQDFEERRFQEVFGKTSHVLAWMASTVEIGSVALPSANTHTYTRPFPSLFSRSQPQIAPHLPPHRCALLLMPLGWLAAGCGLYELAWRAFGETKSFAETQGMHSFQYLMDFELAKLASRKERYQEAFPLALSGIRATPLSVAQPQTAFDMHAASFPAPCDEFWDNLSRERRQEAEQDLYWIIIGPAITPLFAKGAPTEAYASTIMELEAIVRQSEHTLVDHQYWLAILKELGTALSPLATRETIQGQIQTLSEDRAHLRILLYLTLSRTPNATLSEIWAAHTMVFEFLLRQLPTTRLMAEDVAVYLLRYWTDVIRTQGFAPHNHQAFRRVVNALQRPSFSNAATFLLLAADALAIHLNDNLRQSLINAAGLSSE